MRYPEDLVGSWPGGIDLFYDPATMRMMIEVNPEAVPGAEFTQEIMLSFDEQTRDLFVRKLGGDYAFPRPQPEPESAPESPSPYLGLDEEAFAVTSVGSVGENTPPSQLDVVHKRSCLLARGAAKPAIVQAVMHLVRTYRGNVMHEVQFCPRCFGDSLGEYSLTASTQLEEKLKAIAQEHIAARRAARRAVVEKNAGYQPQDDFIDSLDDVVNEADSITREKTSRRTKEVPASALDATEVDVTDEMDPQREQKIAKIRAKDDPAFGDSTPHPTTQMMMDEVTAQW